VWWIRQKTFWLQQCQALWPACTTGVGTGEGWKPPPPTHPDASCPRQLTIPIHYLCFLSAFPAFCFCAHRHSYVRRNAVLAIHALCKLPKGDLLVPDADEHIERFLSQEQDVSAKRNALVMLTHHSQVCSSRGGGGA
jgi:hypothetical protein